MGDPIKPKEFGGKHCLEKERSGYDRHTDTQIFRNGWLYLYPFVKSSSVST